MQWNCAAAEECVVGIVCEDALLACVPHHQIHAQAYGWQSVFYLFGGAGLLWVWAWEQQIPALAAQDPKLVQALTQPIPDANGNVSASDEIPWRAILRQRPFWYGRGGVM